MRIAFDLDDTLIPCLCAFPVEERPSGIVARLFRFEPLRKGTPALLQRLVADGHELCVYTSSMRRPAIVKRLFRYHRVSLRQVINAPIHQARISRLGEGLKTCTKYPPAFGIDLLVDNCDAIVAESVRYGYRVLQVRPDDEHWVEAVFAGLTAIANKAA